MPVMTIEASGKWHDLIPVGRTELTRFDGELTIMHLDSSLTAIRVLSEDELAIFPYVPSGEPNVYKKSEPQVLVREQIKAANIKGRILERSHDIFFRINWQP